ncbi:MAG: excinuclease ABC subunit UvrA, partial [Betaproteobacteria bacterium]|nr:excinuclease ABC subunit UvrA [Betaproteobacteria bacterium]
MIRLRGVRTHNLQNIDLEIPRGQLVVITGLSGSGKSSLAFDTLYAEGQRRYVESLSPYARQFLQLMERPDADLIEGLSPAIAIEQKSNSHNPRSTVGTVTEILDYLRLLFARVGVPHCPDHPQHRLETQSVSQMVDGLLDGPEGDRISLLAPVVSHQKGEHRELLDGLRAQGFVRVRVRSGSGPAQEVTLDGLVALQKAQHHSIDVVVDRLKRRPNLQQRLAESLETALRIGQDRALAVLQPESGPSEERVLSLRLACPECGFSLRDLEPNLFSFNSPAGACPQCDGLGEESRFEESLVVEFPHLSLANGAIAGWDARNGFAFAMLESLAEHAGFSVHEPFERLSTAHQSLLLYGSGEEKIAFTYPSEQGKTLTRRHVFEGVIPNLIRRYAETDNPTVREELGRYRRLSACT